jgi:Flp pilus assembly pilin Flp
MLRAFWRDQSGETYIEYSMIGLILSLAAFSMVSAFFAALKQEAEKAEAAAALAAAQAQVGEAPAEGTAIDPELVRAINEIEDKR